MRLPGFLVLLVILTGLGILTVYQQMEIIRRGYEISRLEGEKERLAGESRMLDNYHARYGSVGELKTRIEHYDLGLLPPEEVRSRAQEEREKLRRHEEKRAKESASGKEGEKTWQGKKSAGAVAPVTRP